MLQQPVPPPQRAVGRRRSGSTISEISSALLRVSAPAASPPWPALKRCCWAGARPVRPQASRPAGPQTIPHAGPFVSRTKWPSIRRMGPGRPRGTASCRQATGSALQQRAGLAALSCCPFFGRRRVASHCAAGHSSA